MDSIPSKIGWETSDGGMKQFPYFFHCPLEFIGVASQYFHNPTSSAMQGSSACEKGLAFHGVNFLTAGQAFFELFEIR